MLSFAGCGLRPSVLGQDRSQTKKIGLGLGLAGLVLLYETRSCHDRRHILKNTATFQVLFIVSLFCEWNITTMERNSGVHLLKS